MSPKRMMLIGGIGTAVVIAIGSYLEVVLGRSWWFTVAFAFVRAFPLMLFIVGLLCWQRARDLARKRTRSAK